MGLPDWTSDYIGLEFENKGRGPDRFDCWGFARKIWRDEYGIDVPDYRNSYESSDEKESVGRAVRHGISQEWVEVDHPITGDGIVLLLRGYPMHIGVVVDPSTYRFLHIHEGTRSVIERWYSAKWSDRIEGFFRHRSQIDE